MTFWLGLVKFLSYQYFWELYYFTLKHKLLCYILPCWVFNYSTIFFLAQTSLYENVLSVGDLIHEKTIVKPKEATEKDLLVVHRVQYLKDLKVRWHFILAVISRIVHYIYHDFIKNRWVPAVGYLCTCLTCILYTQQWQNFICHICL